MEPFTLTILGPKAAANTAAVRPFCLFATPISTVYSAQMSLKSRVSLSYGSIYGWEKPYNRANQRLRQLSISAQTWYWYTPFLDGWGCARRHLCASELEGVTREERTSRRRRVRRKVGSGMLAWGDFGVLLLSLLSPCVGQWGQKSAAHISFYAAARFLVGAPRQSAPGLCATEVDRGGSGAPLACFSFYNVKKVDSASPHRHSRALMPVRSRSGVFLKWFLSFGPTWKCRAHNGKSELYFEKENLCGAVCASCASKREII